MSEQSLIMTLAKVLVATAWADGEPSLDEINSMKDLLGRLPELSARQWASIEMYIDSPVEAAERQRLVEELQLQISTPENKTLALQALDGLVRADGVVSDDERRVVAEIKAAVESVDVGAFGRLSRLVRGIASGDSRPEGPNREVYFEDYVKNRVYYAVSRRLDRGEGELSIPEEALRKLSLAGGMMAKVAGANPQITDAEFVAMIGALQQHWPLSPEEASFVVDVAISQLPSELDDFRLAEEFAAVSDFQERGQFVDALFAIASADGYVSDGEVKEIDRLSRALHVPPERLRKARLQATSGS